MKYSFSIKRKIVKFRRWYNKLKDPKQDKLTKEQEKVIEIINKLISNKDNILLVDLLTAKRYIDGKKTTDGEHSKGEIFVVIDQELISIMNGVYYYDISLPTNTAIKLNYNFDLELSRRRRHLELIKRKNINNRLDDLAEQIK